MAVKYLDKPFAEIRITRHPNYGMCRNGYSCRRGAPTSFLVRLEGEKRFRRVMCWQFSNAGTGFLRVRGESLLLQPHHNHALEDAK